MPRVPPSPRPAVYTRLGRGGGGREHLRHLHPPGPGLRRPNCSRRPAQSWRHIVGVFRTDASVVQNMQMALCEEGKGHRCYGDGEGSGNASKSVDKARPTPADYRLQNTSVGNGGILVNGRRGIVVDVTPKNTSEDIAHLLCVAEMISAVHYARYCHSVSCDEDGDDACVGFNNEGGNRLKEKVVRLLAGESLHHTGVGQPIVRSVQHQRCCVVALPAGGRHCPRVQQLHLRLGKVHALPLALH